MKMLREFSRAGKVFLLGALFGALIRIFSKLYFGSVARAAEGFLEAKAQVFPTNQILLFLTIFLNNTVVILLASVGPMLLVILLFWGRRNISLWGKLNKSKVGGWLDSFVWGIVEFFKPGFSKIKEKVNRDVFVVIYGLPSLVMIVNGWFIGFLFTRSFLNGQLGSVLDFLKWVAPHGVIEIPTIVASAGLGYSLGDSLIPSLYHGRVDEVKVRSRKNIERNGTLKVLFLLVVLLLISAFVEVYLTPRFALSF